MGRERQKEGPELWRHTTSNATPRHPYAQNGAAATRRRRVAVARNYPPPNWREREMEYLSNALALTMREGVPTPFQMWLQNGGYFSTDGRGREGGSEPCQIRFGGIRLRGG